MRQTILVVLLTATVTALVTAWGTTMIMASQSKRVAVTSQTIDVMSIMKGATANLPLQAFDAH